MRDGQNQSAYSRGGKRSAALGHKVIFFQKLTDVRFVIVVMHVFDLIRQSLQKQLRIVFNENHIAGIGQPPTDGKSRLCRAFRLRQTDIFAQCAVSHLVKLGMDTLQNRKEKHFL